MKQAKMCLEMNTEKARASLLSSKLDEIRNVWRNKA